MKLQGLQDEGEASSSQLAERIATLYTIVVTYIGRVSKLRVSVRIPLG